MTNSEFIKTLSKRIGKSQKETKRLLSISNNAIKEVLDEGHGISLPKLGTFQASTREKRRSYDPFHKKNIMLPLKRLITFHPSSVIKKELKYERVKNG